MVVEAYELRVAEVVEETAEASSIAFAVPRELQSTFHHAPGQFLTLAVPSDRTGIVARCYSISSQPDVGDTITVTVKRTPDGYASNWLCDNIEAGDSLKVLPPSGVFTPRSLDADLLLIAGGSGITPMMSILRTALSRGTGEIALFYANRDRASVIFANELAALAELHSDRLLVAHWLEAERGLPTPEAIKAFAEARRGHDAMCCGPSPFMTMSATALRDLGFPKERRRQEKFVSLGGNPFGAPEEVQRAAAELAAVDDTEDLSIGGAPAVITGEGVAGDVVLEVEFEGTSYTFDDWGGGATLVEHLESKGLRVPSSCREGECSACAVTLLEGEVEMANNEVLDEDDLEEGTRLACQATPVTDKVRVAYD